MNNKRSQIVIENTTVGEVLKTPVFKNFRRLPFSVDRNISKYMTLADISNGFAYIWYSEIKKENSTL